MQDQYDLKGALDERLSSTDHLLAPHILSCASEPGLGVGLTVSVCCPEEGKEEHPASAPSGTDQKSSEGGAGKEPRIGISR